MASRYSNLREKLFFTDELIQSYERSKENYERSLNEESNNAKLLKKQLKQMSLAAEDTIWELQETNAELRSKLEESQSKLIEVEAFLDSDRGVLLLNMEEELAACKLRLAEMEAERDDLDLVNCHRKQGSTRLSRTEDKENGGNTTLRDRASKTGLLSLLS